MIKFKCSSFGNKVDGKNWFHEKCFDRFLDEKELISFVNPEGRTIYKCKYCRGSVEEISAVSKSQFRRLEHQLKEK